MLKLSSHKRRTWGWDIPSEGQVTSVIHAGHVHDLLIQPSTAIALGGDGVGEVIASGGNYCFEIISCETGAIGFQWSGGIVGHVKELKTTQLLHIITLLSHR